MKAGGSGTGAEPANTASRVRAHRGSPRDGGPFHRKRLASSSAQQQPAPVLPLDAGPPPDHAGIGPAQPGRRFIPGSVGVVAAEDPARTPRFQPGRNPARNDTGRHHREARLPPCRRHRQRKRRQRVQRALGQKHCTRRTRSTAQPNPAPRLPAARRHSLEAAPASARRNADKLRTRQRPRRVPGNKYRILPHIRIQQPEVMASLHKILVHATHPDNVVTHLRPQRR